MIEDILDIAEILCSLLGCQGHEVIAALNGPEGISKAKEFLALSGYAQPDDLEQSRAAGFNVHLAKPVDLSILQQTLSKIGDSTGFSCPLNFLNFKESVE